MSSLLNDIIIDLIEYPSNKSFSTERAPICIWRPTGGKKRKF